MNIPQAKHTKFHEARSIYVLFISGPPVAITVPGTEQIFNIYDDYTNGYNYTGLVFSIKGISRQMSNGSMRLT